MLKEKIKESGDALDQKQCKWKNYLFDKNGKRYTGNLIFDTQEAAARQLQLWEDEPCPENTRHYTDFNGKRMYKDEYAWSMQMPIMD